MWRIREFFRSIKNLIVWLPIIWRDRQWDNYYIEELLLKKIILIRDYTQKRETFVGWENEVKWMNYCIYLLAMLTKSKYWNDEFDGKIPSNNGLDKVMLNYKESISETTGFIGEFNVLNSSKLYYGDIWEYKSRRLFWKIFIWRYEHWWD